MGMYEAIVLPTTAALYGSEAWVLEDNANHKESECESDVVLERYMQK